METTTKSIGFNPADHPDEFALVGHDPTGVPVYRPREIEGCGGCDNGECCGDRGDDLAGDCCGQGEFGRCDDTCPECDENEGWVLSSYDRDGVGEALETGGPFPVQRCDVCNQFGSDVDAAIAFAGQNEGGHIAFTIDEAGHIAGDVLVTIPDVTP